MIWFGVILFALLGGWLSRMAGGAPPKLPWGLDQWLYALPYFALFAPAVGLIAAVMGINKNHRQYIVPMLLLPYFGAFLGKRTGHGGGIDLAHSKKEPGNGRTVEKLEYLILPLHDKIPRYWYDVLLLSITGLAVTLLAGLLLMFISIPAGALVLISGLMKGPAYMIGWLIYPNGHGAGIPHLNEATAIGEYLTGVFGWGAVAIAGVMILC